MHVQALVQKHVSVYAAQLSFIMLYSWVGLLSLADCLVPIRLCLFRIIPPLLYISIFVDASCC